jgi:acetyl-CoA acyltransferase
METYIGLVEVGVGLIPGGGGLTYIARRAAEMAAAANANADMLKFATDGFTNAAMAKVGTSAIERASWATCWTATSSCRTRTNCCSWPSRRPRPWPTAATARRTKACSRWPAATASPPSRASWPTCATAASSARTTSTSALIAEVVCGGDVDAGSMVTEEYLMRWSASASARLLEHPKTQERIMGMLQTGKPVATESETHHMSKQVQDAYIVAATRTPIGRSGRGYFRNTRPDDLLVAAMKNALAQVPTLDPKAIEDAIIGCSFPEGEQGMNMARMAMVLAGLPHSVGGVTVNRFCASGLTAMQMAADRIRVGEADVMIAGGAESMSMVPMGGNKPSFNPEVFAKRDENVGIAYGMGLTAEKVAKQWKVSREAQDAFALQSHQRAWRQQAGAFADEMTPVEVVERTPNLATGGRHQDPHRQPRRRPAPRHHARRPGQAAPGVRRQGQRDGRQQLADQRRRRRADPGQREGRQAVRPEAAGALRQLCGARRAARHHGHRPIEAIPAALKLRRPEAGRHRLVRAERGLCRAVAGGHEHLGLDPAKVNPMGGAIALGHPLGATGAIRAATVVHALRRHS